MGEQDADDALARSALARIARGDEQELHSLYGRPPCSHSSRRAWATAGQPKRRGGGRMAGMLALGRGVPG